MHSGLPDTQEILSQWNRCHGAFYQVRVNDFQWNLKRQELLTYSVAHVGVVPVLFAIASTRGLNAGIPGHSLWISLWGDVTEGSENDFLLGCERLALEQGKSRLAFAGEEFHFLPGVPIDEEPGRRLLRAASLLGFEQSEACDYAGSANTEPVRSYIAEAQARAIAEGWSLRFTRGIEELDQLQHFLEKEFPGRWTREFLYWRGNEESCRARWLRFCDGQDRLVGFARIALRNWKNPLDSGWTPGALRLPSYPSQISHGDGWDSCLGPIGVAAVERGRGAGKVLLGLVLEKLIENNAAHVCIDWTNAHNYYMPLRFQVVRRFCSLWKKQQG